MATKSRLDAREYFWKQWFNGDGLKLEGEALRRIISAICGLDGEKTISVLSAIGDAMIGSWDAGWTAAGGGEDGE